MSVDSATISSPLAGRLSSPALSENARSRLALAASPLTIAIALRIWYGGPPVFTTDDTYIALHAARLLFDATDPAYPGVPPLTGATSLVHVLMLRAFMFVLSPIWATELVAWLGTVAYLAGAAALIVHRVASTWGRLSCMAIAASLGGTIGHLSSGQETVLAMAAVMWLLYWLDTDSPGERRVPLMAGFLPWIRPDLGLLTLTIAVSRRRTFVRDSVLIALAVLPCVLIYQLAIGRPLPNTVAAKIAFFGFAVLPLGTKIILACLWLLPWLLLQIGLSTLGLRWAWHERSDRPVLVALGLFLCGVIVAGPNVITHNDYRYLHPLMVPTIIAGLATWAGRPHRPGLGPLVLGICLLWPLANFSSKLQMIARNVEIVVTAQDEIATWLNTHEPTGVRVLVHDAGYLSEYSHAQLIDMVGLKSPTSIPAHQRWTAPSQGKDRPMAVHRIACESDPKYYVAFSIWEEHFRLTEGLREFGWSPTPVLQHTVPARPEPVSFTLYRLTQSSRCDS
jgi:hypothetical protein